MGDRSAGIGSVIGFAVIVVAASGILGVATGEIPTGQASQLADSAPITAQQAPAPPVTEVPAPASAPTPSLGIAVAKVIDGDTFVTADGTKVRVLGIDSCEMSTPGGKNALEQARSILFSGNVTLGSEPGVDLDQYGRALRYVQTGGEDFGQMMVGYAHTGIYQGQLAPRFSASAAYLAQLRAADYDGRNCADTSAPPPVIVPSGGDDDHHHHHGGKPWVCRHSRLC